MKLNGQPIHNLKVSVDDYFTNKTCGFCILADCMKPSNYLDMDVIEFQYLYDAVCNMKDLIEKERMNSDTRNNTRIYQNSYEDTCNS